MSVTTEYGTNIAFIEELHEKYQRDPMSVSESWREFFQGYEDEAEEREVARAASAGGAPVVSEPLPQPQQRPSLVTAPAPAPAQVSVQPGETATPLRGAASKIVQNMEA